MDKKHSYRDFDFQFKSNNKPMTKFDTGTSKISSVNLWEEFQEGNEVAFSTIYNDNVEYLYRYGLKLVYDKDLVKDSIQDLFVQLWETKHRLGKVQSIKSYLHRCIRRKLLVQKCNKRKLVNLTYEIEKVMKTPPFEINLIEKQIFNRQLEELEKVLDKLNPNQREIVHLKYYCHLSYAEISEIMSLNKKATYNLMAYTIKLLKQNLETIFLICLIFLLGQ